MKILYEGPDGVKEIQFGSTEAIEQYMSQFDPEEESTADIVDAETGEIIWEKGKKAGETSYHPVWKAERAAKLEKELQDIDDEESREAEEEERKYEQAQSNLDSAIAEFASSYTDSVEELGIDPDDIIAVVSDVAGEFFYQYPDWSVWAMDTGLSKHEILDFVKDATYEKMIS